MGDGTSAGLFIVLNSCVKRGFGWIFSKISSLFFKSSLKQICSLTLYIISPFLFAKIIRHFVFIWAFEANLAR